MEDLLSIEEVTALLGKSRQTVYNMLKDGRLPPAAHLGRLRRWRRSTVEAVIEREAELMSSVEVAQWLGVSRNTAKIWVQEGRLPKPVQWGKVIRWERSVLEQAIAAAEREAAETAAPFVHVPPRSQGGRMLSPREQGGEAQQGGEPDVGEAREEPTLPGVDVCPTCGQWLPDEREQTYVPYLLEEPDPAAVMETRVTREVMPELAGMVENDSIKNAAAHLLAVIEREDSEAKVHEFVATTMNGTTGEKRTITVRVYPSAQGGGGRGERRAPGQVLPLGGHSRADRRDRRARQAGGAGGGCLGYAGPG